MPAAGPVSFVVTDLDGTLWHTDAHVHAEVIRALGVLAERDIPLLVATGRRLGSATAPLAAVGATLPMVLLNGALGVEGATGERFHRAPYPPDEAATVLAAFRSVGLDPVVYVDHPEVEAFLSAAPSTHPDHARRLGGARSDLARVVEEEAVLGFSMIGMPHTDCVAAQDAVGDRGETHLDRSLDYPGRATLTVAPSGQSKWDGVLAYGAARHLDPTRVLAVADGPNDTELLDRAAVRLVPRDAHQTALDRADHVIGAAADGGWAEVLDHLG